MKKLAHTLRSIVDETAPVLAGLSETVAMQRPGPGKWSTKEILGHLVDSATNNYSRFVRAQVHDTLVFNTYEQEMWVKLQGYQDADWQELVSFWRLFNLHIARLIERVPEEVANLPRHPHSLGNSAKEDGAPDTATLADLVVGYIDHLSAVVAANEPLILRKFKVQAFTLFAGDLLYLGWPCLLASLATL